MERIWPNHADRAGARRCVNLVVCWPFILINGAVSLSFSNHDQEILSSNVRKHAISLSSSGSFLAKMCFRLKRANNQTMGHGTLIGSMDLFCMLNLCTNLERYGIDARKCQSSRVAPSMTFLRAVDGDWRRRSFTA